MASKAQVKLIIGKNLKIKPVKIIKHTEGFVNETFEVQTKKGNLHLQEYWVRYKGIPEVDNVIFEGDLHNTTLDVINSIKKADYIILGPSNPVSSIGPIIGVKQIKEALKSTKGKKVAISPIIGENAISGPTPKFLKAWGYQVSPLSVIQLYKDFLDVFMLNGSDKALNDSIINLGVTPLYEDIMIKTSDDAKRIMNKILELF